MEPYGILALIIFILALIGMALAIVNCTIGLACLLSKNKSDHDVDTIASSASRRQGEDIEMGVRKPVAAYGVNELIGRELKLSRSRCNRGGGRLSPQELEG